MSHVDSPSSTTCPVCSTAIVGSFLRIVDQPVHCNVLTSSHDEALAVPRGDLELAFCTECGHIFNRAFDPRRASYGGTYENSLAHSPVFQGYATELVADLVERHDLRDRDIVEIGAGQGDFLEMLCEAGGNRGVGFDPSHVGETDVSSLVTIVRAFYDEQFADQPADLIVCRHVLEHIDRSGDFVDMVRRIIGERSTPAFFEVPNAFWTFVDGGIWDLIYEHCGYFTPVSLAEVFRRAGFVPMDVTTGFGGQFLTIEAEPASTIASRSADVGREIERVGAVLERFSAEYSRTVEEWRERTRAWRSEARRVALWGTGSKGVSFLNTVDPGRAVDVAVDLNPRKVGKFVPGSGQQILAPEMLTGDPPDVILVMNPNYLTEITDHVATLGIDAEMLLV